MFLSVRKAMRLRVPNHPYVTYETVNGRNGFWIWFFCSSCGDVSRKQCSRPHLVSHWVLVYATQHGHDVRPRVG
jgi:hypothetical protein